jgi:hypothetical protein
VDARALGAALPGRGLLYPSLKGAENLTAILVMRFAARAGA